MYVSIDKFPQRKTVLGFFVIWINIVVLVYVYWKISAFTYDISRGNFPSINIQVLLKDIWVWGKYYIVGTMAWCVFVFNTLKLYSVYYQIHERKITFNYHFIDVFILNIICSIINKINNNQVVLRSINWKGLAIWNYSIYRPVSFIFNFYITGNI